MKIKIFVFIIFFTTTHLYAQTTWYISTTGNNLNTGLTMTDAFATVNKAISGASCGDSIYILGGVYREKIIAYVICPDNNRIIIQGDTSNRPLIIGDSTATNKYAISAGGKGFTFRHLELTSPYPNICDPTNMVVAGSGDNMTFIDVIIRNSGYDGMKTTNDCSTSTWADNWKVINCTVINNGSGCASSIQNGDGIDFTACHNCEIIGTSILNNRGHQLQIKLDARNVSVENCRIEGNLLFQIGLRGSTPQCDTNALNADSVFFRHNIIIAKGDTSEFIFKLSDVSNLIIENNTIIKDSIPYANLGFICFGGCASSASWTFTPQSPVIIRNNIFANMSTTKFYAGPDTTYFDPFGITSSNVTDNYNLFYDVNGEYSVPVDGGSSSIVANPLFCDYPNSFDLADGSPCINAGDPLSPVDPDLTRNDIGAKYHQASCFVGLKQLKNETDLFTIYPNPVINSFTLELNIRLKDAEVIIFDMLGMEVMRKRLSDNEMEIRPGESVLWRIKKGGLKSGIYFVSVRDNERQYVQKLIVE